VAIPIGLAIFLFLHFDKKQPFSLQFSLQCALFCIFNLCISKKSCNFAPCLKKHAVWDSQNIRNVFNYPVQTALMIHGPVCPGIWSLVLFCCCARRRMDWSVENGFPVKLPQNILNRFNG